jgi:hypothetical protein
MNDLTRYIERNVSSLPGLYRANFTASAIRRVSATADKSFTEDKSFTIGVALTA